MFSSSLHSQIPIPTDNFCCYFHSSLLGEQEGRAMQVGRHLSKDEDRESQQRWHWNWLPPSLSPVACELGNGLCWVTPQDRASNDRIHTYILVLGSRDLGFAKKNYPSVWEIDTQPWMGSEIKLLNHAGTGPKSTCIPQCNVDHWNERIKILIVFFVQ